MTKKQLFNSTIKVIYQKRLPAFGFLLIGLGIALMFVPNFSTLKECVIIIVGLVFVFYKRLEYLDLSRLKFKLKNTVNEAEEILAKMKAISIPLAKCSLTSLIATGRFSCINNSEKLIMFENIISALKFLDVSEADIMLSRNTFDRLIIHDISSSIWNAINYILREKIKNLSIEERKQAIKDLDVVQKTRENCALSTSPGVSILDKINDFLTFSNSLNEDDKKKINDKLEINFKNLKKYEEEKEFFDKEHFITNSNKKPSIIFAPYH